LKLILVLLAVALTAISLASTPTVDMIQLENNWQYPIFYASKLPPTYYIATAYLTVLAILSKDRRLKLMSVLLIALLSELTPSIMLKNPWLLDQYPYLAEATWLVKTGYIAPVHYLDQLPGLGSMFSQLMLITGLGPIEISKLYPCIVVSAVVIPMFLISEKICRDGALVPLLFLATNFAQINIFHRATYFFMLFSVLMLLLVEKVARERANRSIAILCVLVFSAACITYPGSGMIIIALSVLLILNAFLARVAGRAVKHRIEIMLLIFVVIFFAWSIYVAQAEFAHWIVSNIYNIFTEFSPLSVPPISQIKPEVLGLTPIFDTIILVRLGMVFLVLCLASISALYIIWTKRNFQLFIALLYAGFMVLTAPFIVTFGAQWVILKFTWYIMFTAAACICIGVTYGRFGRIMRLIVLVTILVGLLSVPLLRYASIPYLNIPTEELRAVEFIDTRYNSTELIYCIEYPPYLLHRIQMDKDIYWDIESWPTNTQINTSYNYLTSQRLLTRDGFYVRYVGSYKAYLDSQIAILETTHNLVYTSDPYIKLFIHTTNVNESGTSR